VSIVGGVLRCSLVSLGYRNNPDWRDMSEYVVHFTKDGEQSAYDQMLSILGSRRLKAGGPFGAARGLGGPTFTQQAVCFSEIPLDRLDRLVERRSRYGVGFSQATLLEAGGGRVWYVDRDSAAADAIHALRSEKVGPPMDTDSHFWRITPFIDFPGEYGGTQYRFEWEREWRVPGDFTFDVQDVAFLFIPGDLHEAARAFFREAERENTGPAYNCPFLDPLWGDDKIQEALVGID
jgi:hypothetical protein